MNKNILLASILALSATHASADTNDANLNASQQVSPGASPVAGQTSNMPQGSTQSTTNENNAEVTPTPNTDAIPSPTNNANTPANATPTTNDTSPVSTTNPAGTSTDPSATMNQSNTGPASSDVPTSGNDAATNVSCDTKIPEGKQTVDISLVQQWAQNAALQAFTMNAKDLETQMKSLEGCFTKKGWEGFRSALEKSGNIKVISQEKLTVSASLNGNPTMQSSNDKEWSVLVPINVIYKNEKTIMNQNLNVQLLVSLQKDGKFGIVQIVAAPQKVEPMEEQSSDPQPETTQQSS